MSTDGLPADILQALERRLGDRLSDYAIPPPVFAAMQGELVDFDPERGSLTARFPVLPAYLNPYGTMQGGMVAAAVDNTLGPLSMLVAPPNVTRRLELTYSRPATVESGPILVAARLVERQGRWLYFQADVTDRNGVRLVRAKAVHWIVAERERLVDNGDL